MRATSKLLALAFTAALQPAMADTVLLNFEDLTRSGVLTNQYESKGVVFSDAAFGARSRSTNCSQPSSGPTYQFTRSCGALLLAADPLNLDPNVPGPDGRSSLSITLAGGFVDALSFQYSGNVGTTFLEVHIFDALGNELASSTDFSTAACGGNWCSWNVDPDTGAEVPFSLSFTGVATRVTFKARDETILLDDLQFTLADVPPPTGLPEPTSIALAAVALAGLGWSRKRAAR